MCVAEGFASFAELRSCREENSRLHSLPCGLIVQTKHVSNCRTKALKTLHLLWLFSPTRQEELCSHHKAMVSHFVPEREHSSMSTVAGLTPQQSLPCHWGRCSAQLPSPATSSDGCSAAMQEWLPLEKLSQVHSTLWWLLWAADTVKIKSLINSLLLKINVKIKGDSPGPWCSLTCLRIISSVHVIAVYRWHKVIRQVTEAMYWIFSYKIVINFPPFLALFYIYGSWICVQDGQQLYKYVWDWR